MSHGGTVAYSRVFVVNRHNNLTPYSLSHRGTVAEGLEYLRALPQWTGRGEFNLKHIGRVLQYFGCPQNKVKAVHVAGTNGKGSVSAAIASMLGASGARVGLTISPHFQRINERVVVDGLEVSDGVLADWALEIRHACNSLSEELSFFEAINAIAFSLFSDLQLDWMVVETGLGGRLDATNLIDAPVASGIVTIDRDHQNILGDSVASIAREKAGIIKSGTKLVVGALPQEAQRVIEEVAIGQGVTPAMLGRDFDVVPVADGIFPKGVYTEGGQSIFEFRSPLPGRHQLHNMAVAAAVARFCDLAEGDCQRGLENLFWPGRLEKVECQGRDLYLDSAHNPAGIAQLIDFIRDNLGGKVALGFGVLNTKNWREMASMLLPVTTEWNLLTPHSPSALPLEVLSEYLSGFGISANLYGTDYRRFIAEKASPHSSVPLVVAGSMYMLGGVRALLVREERQLWKRVGG